MSLPHEKRIDYDGSSDDIPKGFILNEVVEKVYLWVGVGRGWIMFVCVGNVQETWEKCGWCVLLALAEKTDSPLTHATTH